MISYMRQICIWLGLSFRFGSLHLKGLGFSVPAKQPLYHFPPGTAASFPCLVAPGAIIGSTSFEYISLTYHNPPLLRHPSFPSLRVKVLPLLRRGRGKTNLLTIKWFNIAYILHQCIMMNVIWIIFLIILFYK